MLIIVIFSRLCNEYYDHVKGGEFRVCYMRDIWYYSVAFCGVISCIINHILGWVTLLNQNCFVS